VLQLAAAVKEAEREGGWLAGLTLVAMVHYPFSLEVDATDETRSLCRAQEAAVLLRCDGIAAASGVTRDALLSEHPTLAHRLVSIVRPPHRFEAVAAPLPPRPKQRRPPRRDDGPQAGGLVVLLVVANLIPRKGVGAVLRVLAALRREAVVRWRLVVAGDGADPAHASALRTLAASLGLEEGEGEAQVAWAGRLDGDALERAYCEADLFLLASRYENYCMAAQEAAFFGLPILAYDVGEIALFCAPGGSVLVPVGDEATLRSRLAHLLRQPRALAVMQDAAHSFAGTLRARLASRPSLQAATGELASLLRRASVRASATARAEDDALSAAHAVRVRGPACAALGLHAALLLLLPIPSEASSLDLALGTARAAGKQEDDVSPSALSILLAAAPVLLVAWPPLLACAARRPLPLRLGRPTELVETGALGLLLLSSALSVSAVLTLRTCLATAPHSLCTHAAFAWSRNPICVSSVGLALSLSALLPSVASALGTVWLALHLSRQVGGPEER